MLISKFKFYKKSDITVIISIKNEDPIILREWMLIKALHISVLQIRIVWRCTAIIAKSTNRSVSILLRNQLSICFTRKNISATEHPTGMTFGMTHRIRSFWVFEQNVPTVNHFVGPMQGDLHLIKLPWKYAGGSITWYCFSARDWLGLLILYWSCLRMNMHSS